MTPKQASEDFTYSDSGIGVANVPPGLPDSLWTVEDVASYLKLQPETVRAIARRGELPAIKLGKVWRFDKTAIIKCLGVLSGGYPDVLSK